MASERPRGHTIRWRIHLASPPDEVYRFLATPEGRGRFWAESAEEADGMIEFRFSNGVVLSSRILVAHPARTFSLTYFDGSRATFRLARAGSGTDLVLSEEGVGDANWNENRPGWVSLLLTLKAAVDHGVDLRNHDPGRGWEDGFVDV